MSSTAVEPRLVDGKLIVPFLKSAQQVIEATAGWKSFIEKPRIKSNNAPEHDFSGLITLSGKLDGVICVSFSRNMAIKLVEAIVGNPIEPESSDFSDAIGELANMVAGSAKNDFGVKAAISTPSVVIGRDHVIAQPADFPFLIIPCRTDEGEFSVEVCIQRMAA